MTLSFRTSLRTALLSLSLSLSLLASMRPAMAADPYQWGNVAMGGGGFVSAVIPSTVEQNLFYARTDVGGAYRWNEADRSWVPLTDWVANDQVGFLGVESIALDPNAPSKVYMLVGISYFNNGKSAILRSNDRGATFKVVDVSGQFKAHGNGMGRQTGERLAVDPNNGAILYCGTRSAGLFKSTDSGATWTRNAALGAVTTPNGNGIDFILFDKTTGSPGQATQTVYMGVSRAGENLYVSKDGGTTWAPIAGRPTDLMPCRAALSSDGSIYITYGNGAGPHPTTAPAEPMDKGAIWKYTPSTGTWANLTPAGNPYAYGGISVDAKDPKKLVATTINKYLQQPWGWGDRIFVSADAGATWTDLFDKKRITMGVNGHPWIENHAIHWAGSVAIDPFNPQRVFVTSGNGIFMTENLDAAASNWNFTVKGLEETVPLDLVSLPGGPLLSVIGDYDGFVHADVKASSPGGLHKPSIGTTSGIAFAAAKPTFVVRAGNDDNGQIFPIYYSSNSGADWTKFATKPSEGGATKAGRVAVSCDGAIVLWSPEGMNSAYRTADLGATWKSATGLSVQGGVPVADPVNAQKFYVYNPASGSVFVSVDGGQSFAQSGSAGNNGMKNMRAAPGREGDLWVAKGALMRSTNSGAAFSAIDGVTNCTAVGFGKAAPGQTYPAIYIWGQANNNPQGIYRSDDIGATWLRLNDDMHQYGGPGNGEFVLGDANIYGRVYMSTAGRGIIYGEIGTGNGIRATGRARSLRPSIAVSARRLEGAGALRFTIAGIREIGAGGSRFTLLDLQGHSLAAGPLRVSAQGTSSFEYRGAGLPPGIYIAHVAMGSAVARTAVVLPR